MQGWLPAAWCQRLAQKSIFQHFHSFFTSLCLFFFFFVPVATSCAALDIFSFFNKSRSRTAGGVALPFLSSGLKIFLPAAFRCRLAPAFLSSTLLLPPPLPGDVWIQFVKLLAPAEEEEKKKPDSSALPAEPRPHWLGRVSWRPTPASRLIWESMRTMH